MRGPRAKSIPAMPLIRLIRSTEYLFQHKEGISHVKIKLGVLICYEMRPEKPNIF